MNCSMSLVFVTHSFFIIVHTFSYSIYILVLTHIWVLEISQLSNIIFTYINVEMLCQLRLKMYAAWRKDKTLSIYNFVICRTATNRTELPLSQICWQILLCTVSKEPFMKWFKQATISLAMWLGCCHQKYNEAMQLCSQRGDVFTHLLHSTKTDFSFTQQCIHWWN